jgi:ElaB/YqjD/DUF883 family membrane-anchored ribosome-binding protein
MNSKSVTETEALRSDIDLTRRRMDDTMEALGDRLHGRHLLDEVIGFFRGSNEDAEGSAARVREKISRTARRATHGVVDTVKENPMPAFLIGAGVAWLVYASTRGSAAAKQTDYALENPDRYDPDAHYDRPLDYPAGLAGETGEQFEDTDENVGSKIHEMTDTIKDKAGAATDQVKEKAAEMVDRAKGKLADFRGRAAEVTSRVRQRAGEIKEQVQDRAQAVYSKTRDHVATTADEHPLELGLGCLAVGVLVGLALPTPEPVNRIVGPGVDRLRQRTRQAGNDVIQKGKRVVQTAASAARQEADSQGLSVDRLRSGASATVQRAASTAADAAGQEGLMPEAPQNEREGAVPADPSAARPAM